MTNSVIIENIDVESLQNIISEAIKNELQNLNTKEPTTPKKGVYGSRKEVAKELRITLPTLHEYTKNGTLKGYRIGGRVLYKWTEVFESLDMIQSLKYKRGEVLK